MRARLQIVIEVYASFENLIGFCFHSYADYTDFATMAAQTFSRGAMMKFPGGLNIQQMMKQAQQMQERMQKQMEEMRIEATAGGGMVTVTADGKGRVREIKIDPSVVDPGDVEELLETLLREKSGAPDVPPGESARNA